MYYSAIGLLAFMLLLIENQDIILKHKNSFEKPAWKVYRRFLFAALVYYTTDILWGVLESHKLSAALFTDTTIYFIVMAAGVLFWIQFMVAYLDEKTEFGKILLYAGGIISALITIITVINIFTPVLFTVDKDCIYEALPLRYVLLGCQILLYFLISVYAVMAILRNKTKKKQNYRTLALVGLLMALFLFLQFWFPYLPLYSIAYMLGTALLHSFVVIDEKEEYRREMAEAAKVAEIKDTISSMLDNIPGMTFTKDARTGVYLACNQAFADMAHKGDPANVIGLTDIQIFNRETALNFQKDDEMALSMDEPYIFFEDVTDEEGKQRQYQTTMLKYTDSTGRLCVLGISQDVTDMVRIQRESATTKEDYEKARSTGIMYSHIAQAMTRGYNDLYYVNVDSEEYIEYRPDEESGSLAEVRRGYHFFEECQIEADEFVYSDDRAAFKKALDRKTLMASLDRKKTFVLTYRLISDEGPNYVSMRVSRMEDDNRFIILGVTDVDEQMKQRRALERLKEEEVAYARLSALTGDFICVYVVDQAVDRYRVVSASERSKALSEQSMGEDFLGMIREAATRICHPEDVNRFLSSFTKENITAEIERHGIYTLSHRILIEGEPLYVQIKAALVEEDEGRRLVVGINDIDAQVRQEELYVKTLAQAQIDANIDALTHVKNRHAYLAAEERLNQQIEEDRSCEFAIVILDVNDLKKVNDTEGHNAGDRYLRNACGIVCDIFKHSPVFRVGGDEFAVIAQGNDYGSIDELVRQVDQQNVDAIENGGIVIACGMARYEGETKVAPVFERADQNMYNNKCELKARKKAVNKGEVR